MKQSLLLPLFFLAVSAGVRDSSKTTLEDIERDYITTQKRTKLTPPPAPKIPSKSPTQFGFIPTKTLTNYVQKEPKANYDLQFQLGNLQQYLGGQQYLGAQQETQGQQYDQSQQYDQGQQYAQGQQYIDTSAQKYIAVSALGGTQYNGAAKKPAPQAYYIPQAQSQYQNFENLQFIADNNIVQQATQQQSYTPQYVYLQQYQAPSSSVQTVVDPKGPPQYVMYLPAHTAPSTEQSQNYENLVYTGGDEQASYQFPQGSPTYNTLQYSQKEETAQNVQPKSQYNKSEYVLKREPKSLLDSYVPSTLQLQYFRKAYQNAIQDGQNLGKHHRQSYRNLDSESSGHFNYKPSSYKF